MNICGVTYTKFEIKRSGRIVVYINKNRLRSLNPNICLCEIQNEIKTVLTNKTLKIPVIISQRNGELSSPNYVMLHILCNESACDI